MGVREGDEKGRFYISSLLLEAETFKNSRVCFHHEISKPLPALQFLPNPQTPLERRSREAGRRLSNVRRWAFRFLQRDKVVPEGTV